MWISEGRVFQAEGITKYKGPKVGACCFCQRNIRDIVAGWSEVAGGGLVGSGGI